MDGPIHCLFISGSQPQGCLHIDAASHTDKETRKQGYQQSRGAHGSQRPVVRKSANHRHIAQIKHDLQHL